jgi:outer membrane lipoprotein carrier protein
MVRAKSWRREARVKNSLWRLGALLACMLCGPALAATSETALDAYLAGLSTWTADFTQSVEDAHHQPAGKGHGRMVIVRPGRFRWESAPEGAADAVQLLVADGRNLWFYDVDLQQATVRPQQDALPQSPAMLLAGGADLRAAFTIKSTGKRDGLEWTSAQPKDPRSDFREALFGFKGTELQRLVITDKLGQTSTLTFTAVRRNAPVDAAVTQFTPPKGVDVIGKPVAP